MKDAELRQWLQRIDAKIDSVHDEVKLARAETREVDSRLADVDSRLSRDITKLRDNIAEHFELLEVRLDQRYVRKA